MLLIVVGRLYETGRVAVFFQISLTRWMLLAVSRM